MPSSSKMVTIVTFETVLPEQVRLTAFLEVQTFPVKLRQFLRADSRS